MTKHRIAGSEHPPVTGAHAVGDADPAERIEVSVQLRSGNASAFTEHVARAMAATGPVEHVAREAFAARYGATSADIDKVARFATAHGLTVVMSDAARRVVVLSGTASAFNEAFGVRLQQFEHEDGSYRGHAGPIYLPEDLDGVVQAVLGLDNRSIARPHFRIGAITGKTGVRAKAAGSFTPIELASLYQFPAGTGSGQCIGIIELGGGYRPADLTAYFKGLGIAKPSVTSVSVDHARNHPSGNPNSADGEVALDIEVAGAVAPSAKIVVYFAPNTDAGFLDAITTAIHDTVHKPSVISISWGGPESTWSQQSLDAYDQAFQAAATLGVTVCAASGDSGSSDGVSDGADHVDFPASSPHVLACGGTRLAASGGGIASETVWNDGAQGGAGGGGVSAVFAVPTWQAGIKATKADGTNSPLAMRGVPDVAGDADPQTGYSVLVDGQSLVFGGTSAVAPLWAGLIARINAIKGHPVGFMQPALYAQPAACNDVTQGDNGDFAAAAGWDACTGLGSPIGRKVAGLF